MLRKLLGMYYISTKLKPLFLFIKYTRNYMNSKRIIYIYGYDILYMIEKFVCDSWFEKNIYNAEK